MNRNGKESATSLLGAVDVFAVLVMVLALLIYRWRLKQKKTNRLEGNVSVECGVAAR